jgi:hypothetical protein
MSDVRGGGDAQAATPVSEKVAWRLAAIHGGDWLLNLLMIALLVSVWR